MQEFKVFQQILDTPGTNEKIEILKRNDTPELRKLLWLTYNKFLTYRVKQLDFPLNYNRVQPDITEELEIKLMQLSKHSTGASETRKQLKYLMAKCTEAGAGWVAKIINRDLKIGINVSNINKAFPGLIPEFNVQLAHPIYSGGKNPKNYWPKLKYPIVVEEKLDGVRVIAVVKDGIVTIYSREGHEEYQDHGIFAQELLKIRPGSNYVIDGEAIAKKFNPDCSVSIKHKDSNRWPFEQAKSMLKNSATTKAEIEEYVGYYIWDIIELDFFESQGAEGAKIPLANRKLQLRSLFERNDLVARFNNVFLVPNVMANNEEEVKGIFDIVRTKGGNKYTVVNSKGKEISYTMPRGEGVMVKNPDKPYEFKRSDAVLKVKEFYTCDLRIIDAYEGEKGSKLEGALGGLVLASDCGTLKTDCGCFRGDELQRFDMWVEHLAGRLTGKIVEVSYQELTPDGSLTFPVFIRIRDDKTTTSIG